MDILVIMIMLGFFWFNPNTNYYAPKWFFLSIMVAVMMSIEISFQSHLLLGLMFFTLIFSSLYSAIYPFCKMLTNRPEVHIRTKLETSRTSMALFFCGIYFILVTDNQVFMIQNSLFILIITNFLWHLIPDEKKRFINRDKKLSAQLYKGGSVLKGFGGNASVDATLVSIVNAFILCSDFHFNIKIASCILSFFCIYRNRATSGMIALIASSFFFLVFVEKIYLSLISLPLMFVALYFKYGKELFSLSGRDFLWGFSVTKVFKQIPNKTTGIGNGAFKSIFPVMFPVKKDGIIMRFPWAHNDFVQLLIEGGILSLSLLAILIGYMFYISPLAYYPFFIAYIINSFCNFPNHLAPDIFLLLTFLKKCF